MTIIKYKNTQVNYFNVHKVRTHDKRYSNPSNTVFPCMGYFILRFKFKIEEVTTV